MDRSLSRLSTTHLAEESTRSEHSRCCSPALAARASHHMNEATTDPIGLKERKKKRRIVAGACVARWPWTEEKQKHQVLGKYEQAWRPHRTASLAEPARKRGKGLMSKGSKHTASTTTHGGAAAARNRPSNHHILPVPGHEAETMAKKPKHPMDPRRKARSRRESSSEEKLSPFRRLLLRPRTATGRSRWFMTDGSLPSSLRDSGLVLCAAVVG